VVEQIPPVTPVPPPPRLVTKPPQTPARLGLDGPQSITPGIEFTVAVLVDDVADLYSAPLFVKYDPKLLDFVDANEGSFLSQLGQTTVFSTSPNRTAGQVIVGYKQGVGGKGSSGDGVLYTLKFKAKANGDAKVSLDRINFRDPKGSRLAVEPASMLIEIR
jgi:general secretion pathway protein D